MGQVKKAGCILINQESKMIGLVYRQTKNDYSFPKGHLEQGETLKECAVRETEEEVGRICTIIPDKTLPVLKYITPKGRHAEAFYFLAKDIGPSETVFDPKLVHKIVWVSYNDVDKTLSYPKLIKFWNDIKPFVAEVLDEN